MQLPFTRAAFRVGSPPDPRPRSRAVRQHHAGLKITQRATRPRPDQTDHAPPAQLAPQSDVCEFATLIPLHLEGLASGHTVQVSAAVAPWSKVGAEKWLLMNSEPFAVKPADDVTRVSLGFKSSAYGFLLRLPCAAEHWVGRARRHSLQL